MFHTGFSKFNLNVTVCDVATAGSSNWLSVKLMDSFGNTCTRTKLNQKVSLTKGKWHSFSLTCEKSSDTLRNIRKTFFKRNRYNVHDQYCLSDVKIKVPSWDKEYGTENSQNVWFRKSNVWESPFGLGKYDRNRQR